MFLSEIDDAVRLRNYRKSTLDLLDAVNQAIEVKLLYRKDIEIASIIDISCIREAIRAECLRLVKDYERQLADLGVEITP